MKTFFAGDAFRRQLQEVLPTQLTADRMVRTALSSMLRTPKLLEVPLPAMASALILCSEIGLEPNGRDCHLVPFNNHKLKIMEVVVIPDFKGLIKLAYQSGQVTKIMARAVYEGDSFVYQYGTRELLEHRPASGNRGKLTHAWASARLADSTEPVFLVLDREEVMLHKKSSRSASSSSSPWNTFEAAMWAKTAIRELAKFIPQSPRLEQAIQQEMQTDFDRNLVITAASSAVETITAGMITPEAPEPVATREVEAAPADPAPETNPVDEPAPAAEVAAPQESASAPAGPQEDDQDRLVAEWRDHINGETTLSQLDQLVKDVRVNDSLSQASKETLLVQCNSQAVAIREKSAGRGQGKLLDGTQASATEAGL